MLLVSWVQVALAIFLAPDKLNGACVEDVWFGLCLYRSGGIVQVWSSFSTKIPFAMRLPQTTFYRRRCAIFVFSLGTGDFIHKHRSKSNTFQLSSVASFHLLLFSFYVMSELLKASFRILDLFVKLVKPQFLSHSKGNYILKMYLHSVIWQKGHV